MKSSTKIVAFVLLTTTMFCGCGDGSSPPGSTSAPLASTAKDDPGSDAPAVASIVFIGQREACSCDRERIDKGWQALQKVLGQGKNVAVKRLQIDVDEAEADTYDDLRSMMVLPGLYFLDDKGELVELLQGEVAEHKIAEVLR